MKKTIVAMLLGLNIVLGGVLMTLPTPKANAQAFRQTDYLTATAVIERDYDSLWVIDLASKRMIALRLDRGRRKMVPSQGRRLANDFQERN